ncbi:hypothetical protein BJV78DRAFT_1309158 [Lactifluus subvellereus]|nr:hypothetical protein BJV78DRAFT_1309158 [Lactifluus subvellereus]
MPRASNASESMCVYANHANFSEIDDVQPSLNTSLLEGERGVTEYSPRMAAFTNINSRSLFFSDSVGEGSTRNILHRLQRRNWNITEGRQQQARDTCCERCRRVPYG